MVQMERGTHMQLLKITDEAGLTDQISRLLLSTLIQAF